MDTHTFPHAQTHATFPKAICASERVKLIGTIDARFPDFGHHQEREMGGLWLHPIKLLDGFWLRMKDGSADNMDTWLIADAFEAQPWGNTFHYGGGLGHTRVKVTERRVCPEEAAGLIVAYELHNRGDAPCPLEIEWLARTDIQPVWFSETADIRSGGPDEGAWLDGEGLFLAKDPAHEWYAAIGSEATPDRIESGDLFGPENTCGEGTGLRLSFAMTLAPDEHRTLRFFVSGSHTARADCLAQYKALAAITDWLPAKEARYGHLLSQSRLLTPDARFDAIYDWVKIGTDWLIMDCGPYGRGLAAGLPEYPWWFGCDNCYALQGVLAMGDFRLAHDTLLLLLEYSEKHNGNGRILHEVTTGGICANPGNTQETAHFVVMLWLYYEWTGDFSLIERAFPYLAKSIAWLKAQDPEGEGFPGGYGIIEIAGLNSRMIDTAVYAAEAYRCYGLMCGRMGKAEEAASHAALAAKSTDAINTLMWDEAQGLYCDAFTSVEEVLARKDAILENRHAQHADKAEAALEAAIAAGAANPAKRRGMLLNYNWVINTPLEMGIAPQDQAARALARLHTPEFIGPYGMYLSGIYQDATMTISTGVMAIAQARYGHADRALELIERMFTSHGQVSPGCIAEMSPDYGCTVQAWTAYAAFTPIVRHFFGVQPDGQRITLNPCMPGKWTTASLTRVPVLDGLLDLHYSRDAEGAVLRGSFSGKCTLQYNGTALDADGFSISLPE